MLRGRLLDKSNLSEETEAMEVGQMSDSEECAFGPCVGVGQM